jgi:hypothetical protein
MISQVVVIGVSGMALAAKIVAVENRYGCEARPVLACRGHLLAVTFL